jgi:hypothetical protein
MNKAMMATPPAHKFRVFSRVPAPGVPDSDLYIPQYWEGGVWRGFYANNASKQVSFATEIEAHKYVIEFVVMALDKTTERINRLYAERTDLEQNLKALNKESIAINARNV